MPSSSGKPPSSNNRNRPGSEGRSEGRGGRDRPQNRDSRKSAPEGGPVLIWGSHAAEAALRNDNRDIFRILMTETGEERLKDALAARHAMTSAVQGRQRVERTTPQALDIPRYHLHPLKGGLKGFWAVTVRANWRIIFRFDDADACDVDLIDYH